MSEADGANGKKLWPIIISAASVAIVVLGGAITFISQISGLSIRVTEQTGQITGLQAQLQELTDRYNANRSRLDVVETNQKRVETQFCAMDVVRNLMHAYELRVESMLWEKAFQMPIPTDNAYYPTFCGSTKPESK